jgi:predicted RNase H-like nuclease (RuvC/YqgF family)
VKALKKFEFMFEEERFSKVEVKNELSLVSEKCDKFKNTIDRLNNKLSKREREIARLTTDLEYFKKREQDLLS